MLRKSQAHFAFTIHNDTRYTTYYTFYTADDELSGSSSTNMMYLEHREESFHTHTQNTVTDRNERSVAKLAIFW